MSAQQNQNTESSDGRGGRLAGLTTRGRSFLAAGLAAMACGMLFDYKVLLRVGAMLALLPLISIMVLARTRYRVSCRRALEPAGSGSARRPGCTCGWKTSPGCPPARCWWRTGCPTCWAPGPGSC
ncbi:hypothetical protein ACFQ9X_44930 [Catenulispora yoronensis]